MKSSDSRAAVHSCWRLAAVLIALGTATPLTSQTAAPPTTSEDTHDGSVAYGVIGGAAQLPASRTMQDASAVLVYRPTGWIELSVNPSLVRATAPTTTGGTVSSTGLTDLPLAASVSGALKAVPWSPDLAAGVEVTLPTGATNAGLGSGRVGFAGDWGLNASPTDQLSVDVNVWHPFAGLGVNSALDAAGATSLGFEAAYQWSDRWSTTVGYLDDVGRADSGATLPQSIAAGFVFTVAKPLALTLDATHGVTSGAPRWLVSLGLGTAFSEINPLGPGALLSRLRQSVGRSVNRGQGRGNVGGSCRGRTC